MYPAGCNGCRDQAYQARDDGRNRSRCFSLRFPGESRLLLALSRQTDHLAKRVSLMKLLQYGVKGREKPGLVDVNGGIRDLS
ncbi:MAG: hypothetical protein OXD44_06570, partial [Gammaproteobacteria bacterium]|nr:hypothetical protein [Gammaproteobacteria bacterium]